MAPIIPGMFGILPSGALGVGFFYHLTDQLTRMTNDVVFIERRGSLSAQALRESGTLSIATPNGIASIPTDMVLKPDLIRCYESREVPEVILICPNPDQLLGVITTSIELVIRLHEADQLFQDPLPFPTLVFCSNGIYFQRFRQIFIEKLEEATLFGRLPDLWSGTMPSLVSRFLRGVTIQTGVRDGSGEHTIYRPGPRGLTRVAGGNDATQRRCCHLLTEKGGWFEQGGDRTPTRLEFDKALVNLACNLLGQIYAIDNTGHFRSLTVGDIAISSHRDRIRELAHHVFTVGQHVNAYSTSEEFDTIYHHLMQVCEAHADHVPSSLQWVETNLRQGRLKAEITPTEGWLIEPLIRYAKASDLSETVRYFEALKRELLQKLERAIAASAVKHASI
ncbi:MAG: hypothetical protein ACFE0J_16765 [Elainellaceae cyanobacterium]